MASVKETLITIKTANGTAADMTVKCPLKWCVFDIKTHIMENHPLHPVREKSGFLGSVTNDDQSYMHLHCYTNTELTVSLR